MKKSICLIFFALICWVKAVSASCLSSVKDDFDAHASLIRSQVHKLIEIGNLDRALEKLRESVPLVNSIFDACKTAELFIKLDYPKEGLLVLKRLPERSVGGPLRYQFEAKELLSLLNENYSTETDLIRYASSLIPSGK